MDDRPQDLQPLLVRTADGDQAAFNILCHRYQGFIKAIIRQSWDGVQASDADEVQRDIFFRLWQARQQLPEIGADDFEKWLRTVARNATSTKRTSAKRIREKEGAPSELSDAVSPKTPSSEHISPETLLNILARCGNRLSLSDQLLLVGRHLLAANNVELARAFEISKATLRKRSQRLYERLRKILNNESEPFA